MAAPPDQSAHGRLDQQDDRHHEGSHDIHAYVTEGEGVTAPSNRDATGPANSGSSPPAVANELTNGVRDVEKKDSHHPSTNHLPVSADADQTRDAANEEAGVQSEAGRGSVQHGGSIRGEKGEHCGAGTKKCNGNTDTKTAGGQRLEDLIEDLGGFGPFQGLLLCAMFGAKMSVAFSVMLMTFAAATPDWWCRTSANATSNNRDDDLLRSGGNMSDRLKQCEVNGTQCEDFTFSSRAFYGIVSEWDLVCDRSWLASTITSVQMAGLFMGAMGAGQLADLWGRRKTVYLTILIQAVFSLGAGFANSLQVFTACRFFAGLAAGGFIVVYFPLPLEFLGSRWRSLQGAIPTWSLGAGLLALAAWLIQEWRWLNWAGAIFSGLFLLVYPITPESVRWLVLHNRIDEAEKVIRTVATLNRKPMPNLDLIHEVALREAESNKKGDRKYSYLDLFKTRRLIKTTLILNFAWFCCGLVYYTLAFGVDVLSGSLYLNAFLMSVLEIPSMLITVVLNNSRLGRRWTSFLFSMVACVMAAAAVITAYVDEQGSTAVRVEILICKMSLAAAWPCIQLLATESFPTVIRSTGYGTCNMSSRVGGVIAPYLARMGADYFGVVYSVVAVLMAACAGVCLLCRETRGRALADTINDFLADPEPRDAQQQK